MSNVLGTSFATGGFTFDPNLSPNNQSFAAAVYAITKRLGLGTGGGGGGTGSVTGIDHVMAGAGTSCGTWSNQAITTSGTATLRLNAFNGTLAGLVPSSAGGSVNFLRADGSFAVPPGNATVTSISGTDASTNQVFGISGVPITTSGTFTMTLVTQSANKLFAGPSSGAAAQPNFRSLVAADIPGYAGFSFDSVFYAHAGGI